MTTGEHQTKHRVLLSVGTTASSSACPGHVPGPRTALAHSLSFLGLAAPSQKDCGPCRAFLCHQVLPQTGPAPLPPIRNHSVSGSLSFSADLISGCWNYKDMLLGCLGGSVVERLLSAQVWSWGLGIESRIGFPTGSLLLSLPLVLSHE